MLEQVDQIQLCSYILLEKMAGVIAMLCGIITGCLYQSQNSLLTFESGPDEQLKIMRWIGLQLKSL